MKIGRLKVKNFRNYDDLDIFFNNKLNIIIGNNAQGKTNILEAIYFLSITKSNLPVNDKICIKKNKLFFKLEGEINSFKIDKKISLLLNSNGKKLQINGNEVKKHYEYIGNLKVIIFNPDDVRLMKDAPGNRRRFLNIEISQLYTRYINILNEYNLVLKQRNEYLKVIKIKNYNQIYFDILNDKLTDLAVIIYDYRVKFIDNINKYIGDIFEKITGIGDLSIKYIPNVSLDNKDNLKELILDKLIKNYDKELLYGSTLIGPHRDDFIFKLNDMDLLLYGSQGQQKAAILALKLSELDVFNEICGEYPVLLLDDLFSELDVDKRNKIINYLNRDIQTIVTTTDLKNIDKRLVKSATIFEINDGKVINSNYKKDVVKNE